MYLIRRTAFPFVTKLSTAKPQIIALGSKATLSGPLITALQYEVCSVPPSLYSSIQICIYGRFSGVRTADACCQCEWQAFNENLSA